MSYKGSEGMMSHANLFPGLLIAFFLIAINCFAQNESPDLFTTTNQLPPEVQALPNQLPPGMNPGQIPTGANPQLPPGVPPGQMQALPQPPPQPGVGQSASPSAPGAPPPVNMGGAPNPTPYPVLPQDPNAPPNPFAPPPGMNSNMFPQPSGPLQPTPPAANETVLPPPTAPTYTPIEVDKTLPKEIYASIRTSLGAMRVKMNPFDAPRNVRNFIELARGEKEFTDAKTGKKVRKPFYNGLIVHRAIKGFLIQTGCPFGTGRGGPGFTVADEIGPRLKFDRPGVVAMANARTEDGKPDPNTNGSQFFITLSPQPELDGKYTIIGQVIGGQDVLKKIASTKTGPTDRPIKRVYISSVDIQTK